MRNGALEQNYFHWEVWVVDLDNAAAMNIVGDLHNWLAFQCCLAGQQSWVLFSGHMIKHCG